MLGQAQEEWKELYVLPRQLSSYSNGIWNDWLGLNPQKDKRLPYSPSLPHNGPQ
jgi:hypothetical protein